MRPKNALWCKEGYEGDVGVNPVIPHTHYIGVARSHNANDTLGA